MKSLLTFIYIFFVSSVVFANSTGFNYQVIVRDGAGMIKENASVSIGFEILDNADNVIYTESHTATTNAYGLVTLTIGGGTTSDDFSSIDWSTADHSIKVTIDGTDMGTTSLMSVPYANYASNGITTAQADSIVVNTAKVGITTDQADAIIANTAKIAGATATEI